MGNKIKVGLVQINNSFSNLHYLPYSVGLLQSYYMRYGKEPDRFEFLDPIYCRMPIKNIVASYMEADVVAFSVYSWNFMISLEIAKRLKKNKPSIIIVFGGPHVPDDAESLLRKYSFIDIACHGDGENIFTRILDSYHLKNWKDVPSISYLEKDNYIQNKNGSRVEDISSIPSPYLNEIFERVMKKNPNHKWMALWETNRGCPFSCVYCDWGSYDKSKIYKFDMIRLKKEIDWFVDNKIEYVYCCDPNFGILERDIEIVEYIAEKKKRYGYPKSLSVHDTKNSTEIVYKIQKILYESGLSKGASLSLQSLDKVTLKNIGRKNISSCYFKELQGRFNRDGIPTFTDIIQGLPGETYESFTNGISKLIDLGQHSRIRFGTLYVLPNAPLSNPIYHKNHGLVLVDTVSKMQHSSLDDIEDDVDEMQCNVVGTETMPLEDWVSVKAFSWWCSLLYCDKLLQIPLLLLHNTYGFSFKELFERFNIDDDRYPIVSKIQRFFIDTAKSVQSGGQECIASPEYLNIYFPADEYMFIRLTVDNEKESFYKECQDILSEYIMEKGFDIPLYLKDAVHLNCCLMKEPYQDEDVFIKTDYNILDAYESSLNMKEMDVVERKTTYRIIRSDNVWNTWSDWCREVVWYGNKQCSYIYDYICDMITCPSCGERTEARPNNKCYCNYCGYEGDKI